MKEPVWIELVEVLLLHDRLLDLDGGAVGLRDEGLLLSALARPKHKFFYSESVEIVDLAALYTSGIVKNHPFVDGNKRTGFLIGVLFIEDNGYRFGADEDAATQAILDLAAGTIDETAFTAWLKAWVVPAD